MRATTRSRPRTSIISNRPAPLVLPLTAMRAGWMTWLALRLFCSANSRKTASIASCVKSPVPARRSARRARYSRLSCFSRCFLPLVLVDEILAEKAIGHGREFAEGFGPDLIEVEDLRQVVVGDRGGGEPGRLQSALDEGEQTRILGLHDVLGVEPAEFLDVELGLDIVHLRDLEEPDGFGGRHDLAPILGHPAEEDEVIGQGLGQEAFTLVLLDGDAAVALGELGPVGPQDERHVAEPRRLQAEGFVEDDLFRRVADVVVAPEDVGDAEVGVVDDAGEVVGRRAVRLDHDLVLDRLRLDGDPAVDEVLVSDRPAGLDLEEDSVAVLVGLALGHELRGLGAVDIEPPALEDGLLVPVEPQPLEVLEDLVEESRFGPFQVGVFDAEQEFPPGMAGVEPVEDGRPGAPDMEEARRAGGKSYTNHASLALRSGLRRGVLPGGEAINRPFKYSTGAEERQAGQRGVRGGQTYFFRKKVGLTPSSSGPRSRRSCAGSRESGSHSRSR